MGGLLGAFGIRRRPTPAETVVELFITWGMVTLGLWVTDRLLEGIRATNTESLLVASAALALVNSFVRPLLFWLSLPVTILTLGLFLLVLNAAMLAFAAWLTRQVDGLHFVVDGLVAAVLGALIVSLVTWGLRLFVDPPRIARKLVR